MRHPTTGTVVTRDGRHGTLQPYESRKDRAVIRMDDGQRVVVPENLLVEEKEGSFFLPLDLTDKGARDDTHQGKESVLVIPVMGEHMEVARRRVDSGGVRITKEVHEREVDVDEPGFEEEIHVERVAIDQVLNEPVEIHYRDHTLIIPIMEEVLVVAKRLVLKEELRITKERKELRRPQRVRLRTEEVSVQRLDAEDDRADDHKDEYPS